MPDADPIAVRRSDAAHAAAQGLRPRLIAGLAELSTASFRLVMATGILALASRQQGWTRLSTAMFATDVLGWLVLWVLTLLRLFRHPRRFVGDLVDHLRGPGFFTMVAGTAIVGAEFTLLANDLRTGVALWFGALALWLLLTYTVFAAFTIKEDKPPLDRGISGGWLLAVVATQSLAVLGALIAARIGQPWRSRRSPARC